MKFLRQKEFSEADHDSVLDHTHYHSLTFFIIKKVLCKVRVQWITTGFNKQVQISTSN